MSSVLDRSALEQSPLADLHLLANELGVDGFRRLRKADLIDALIAHQSGGEPPAAEPPRPRSRRRAADAAGRAEPPRPTAAEDEDGAASRARGRRGGRGPRRGGRDATRRRRRASRRAEAAPRAGGRRRAQRRGHRRAARQRLRLPAPGAARGRPTTTSTSPPRRSSAASSSPATASAARCAPPRRSERYPSLVRVDTINGRPADEVAEGTRFEDLPVAWPAERIELGSEDPTVKAIEWLTPFGKGSRVTIVGAGARRQDRGAAPPRRRARRPRGARGHASCSPASRPEEIAEWSARESAPAAALGLRRLRRRAGAGDRAGGRAGPPRRRARRRRGRADRRRSSTCRRPPRAACWPPRATWPSGGSLTVIATSPAPVGGETTVVALDPTAAGARPLPRARAAAVGDAAAGAAGRRRGRRGDQGRPGRAGAAAGRPEPAHAATYGAGGRRSPSKPPGDRRSARGTLR